MIVCGIDPGNIESAYCCFDFSRNVIISMGKVDNDDLVTKLVEIDLIGVDRFAIEKVTSYGMPVGETVFETVFWSGIFYHRISIIGHTNILRIPRIKVKSAICHNSRAKDANIRQALIDMFGPVGTKKNQGILYGVKSDIWAALAVAVTAYKMENKQ